MAGLTMRVLSLGAGVQSSTLLLMAVHDYLRAHDYPIPRKSACIACPLRSVAEWREIKADAASWADAVDFDERIRRVRDRTRLQEVFVFREAIPLPIVDLRSEQDRGQIDMFDETDGCGVLCPAEVA